MARRLKAARAAGSVGAAVLISRVLGLIREQVLAAFFGAGLLMDAWLVAFRIPNMLRDLFAEGALSSAFVPTFTRTLQKEGREGAWLLANLVISALLVLLGLLSVVFAVFSDQFVYLLAAGYEEVPGKVEVTANLLQILSPFLIFIALASVAMGILNTLDQFFLPALAPAIFNVSLILATVLLVPWLTTHGILGVYALGIGALAGGFLQFAVQIPLLRKQGFRFRFRLDVHHSGLKQMARLIGPAVVGVSAVQINILVNTQLASLMGNGPVSWLSYAFRVLFLPVGLFGVAVGVVNLREVSIHAGKENWEQLKETVANSIKLVSLLAMPSTVGLIVLAQPIIRVLFERGRFNAEDTVYTSYALMGYALGMFAISSVKIYVPTFYALGDTRTPVSMSVAAVVINIVFNVAVVFFLLPEKYGFVGLALGTSVSMILNTSLLALFLGRRLGSMKAYRVASALTKTSFAAIAMGASIYALRSLMRSYWGQLNGLELGLCIAVGAGVYFGLCLLLRVEEMDLLLRKLRRAS